MLIARASKAQNETGSGLCFGVIGTCRVHNPMRAMIDEGRVEMIWREFNAFTHGPAEAIQYLRFVRGDSFIPDSFSPFIFRTEQTPDVDDRLMSAMSQLDFLIVEISAFARLSCGAFEFQQNYFSENFIRRGGADYLNWWRDITQGKPAMTSADELVQSKTGQLALHDEEILRTLRFSNLGDEEFLSQIRELSRVAGVPLLLVPHFSYDTDDGPISRMRTRNRSLVGRAATELSHDFFDPSPLLMAYGRKTALKNEGRDLYHYSVEFDAHIGHSLMDRIEAIQLPAATGAAAG
jgi:hypothetical protein